MWRQAFQIREISCIFACGINNNRLLDTWYMRILKILKPCAKNRAVAQKGGNLMTWASCFPVSWEEHLNTTPQSARGKHQTGVQRAWWRNWGKKCQWKEWNPFVPIAYQGQWVATIPQNIGQSDLRRAPEVTPGLRDCMDLQRCCYSSPSLP